MWHSGDLNSKAPLQVTNEHAGQLKFRNLNVDENPQTASKHQSMGIPQILFFKDVQVIDESISAVPKSALRSKAESVLRAAISSSERALEAAAIFAGRL